MPLGGNASGVISRVEINHKLARISCFDRRFGKLVEVTNVELASEPILKSYGIVKRQTRPCSAPGAGLPRRRLE